MPALSSPKAERFAQELARGVHYREAYVKAGYKDSKSNAHALWKREDVNARVSELIALEAEAQGITLEAVVSEIGAIAFLDAGDFFHWDSEGVTVKAVDTLTLKQRKAIVGVKETVRGIGRNRESTIEVKLADKLGALEKLLKHLAPKPGSEPDQHLHLHVESPLSQIEGRIAGLAARLGTGGNPLVHDARAAGSAPLGLELLGPPKTIDAEPARLGQHDGADAGR